MLRAPEKRSNHASARRRASRSEAHPHESIGSMSTDKRHVLAAVPAGGGLALDLGGGAGELSSALGGLGYQYVNLDPAARGAGAVAGDAQGTPFRTGAFSLVVSSDSLEHIADPRAALREVRRLLAPEGSFIVWVPFLHPFHGFYHLGVQLERMGVLGLASQVGQLVLSELDHQPLIPEPIPKVRRRHHASFPHALFPIGSPDEDLDAKVPDARRLLFGGHQDALVIDAEPVAGSLDIRIVVAPERKK